jgi:MoaA/NifB/PqqE/SkfB family radical SAM enzyme
VIKEEYSPYKIVHHTEDLKRLKNGQANTPIQVQLVLTNKCGHRCQTCSYHLDKSPSNADFFMKDELDYKKAIEIINDCRNMGVEAIQLTGGGEPTIYPRFGDILTHIVMGSMMKVALVTNGEKLTESISDILVNHGSWVRISLDAATKETYGEFRGIKTACFDKTLNNIKYLVKEKKKHKSDLVIGIGFVVNQYNYKEIYKAVELAQKIGVDNIRISGAFTPEGFGHFDSFFDVASKEARIAKNTFENSKFTVFNLFDDRIKDTQEVQDYDFCPIKEIQAYIGADYNVYTCCTLAYNKRGLVGSIKDQSFAELWDSEDKQKLFKAHNPKKMCKLPCLYKAKNEFINYCIKENPRHVEFI